MFVHDPGFETRYGQEIFICILQSVQAVSRIHPTSYPEYRGSFPGIKRPGREVYHLHLVLTLWMNGVITFLHLHAWTKVTLLFRVMLVRIRFITFASIFKFPLYKQTPQSSVISDISIKVAYIFFQKYGTYISNVIKYSCTFNRTKMVHKIVKILFHTVLTAKRVTSCLPL